MFVDGHAHTHTRTSRKAHGTVDVGGSFWNAYQRRGRFLPAFVSAEARRRVPPRSSGALLIRARTCSFTGGTRLTSYRFASSIFTACLSPSFPLPLPPSLSFPPPTTTLLTSSSCHVTSLLALKIASIETNGGAQTGRGGHVKFDLFCLLHLLLHRRTASCFRATDNTGSTF